MTGFFPTLEGHNFYPRSPCGERLYVSYNQYNNTNISIHALLAESDSLQFAVSVDRFVFLSTLSLRRATLAGAVSMSIKAFLSTLSLRRATLMWYQCNTVVKDFYPRSPCGERPAICQCTAPATIFLSTLSLRRATAKVHKTVGHFCAYGTNFMGISSSC